MFHFFGLVVNGSMLFSCYIEIWLTNKSCIYLGCTTWFFKRCKRWWFNIHKHCDMINPVVKVKVLVAQSCLTLCDPMDYNLPGSSVHGIPQARILEWVASSFSRGPYWPRDGTCVSYIGRWILYHWTTWETLSGWNHEKFQHLRNGYRNLQERYRQQ